MCMKVREIFGLLYRTFTVMFHLATTIFVICQATSGIRQSSLEPQYAQRYQIARKCGGLLFEWDCGHQKLADMVALPSLETRSLQLSLCMLYNIIHNLCYFLAHIITPTPNVSRGLTDDSVTSTICSHKHIHVFICTTHRESLELPEQIVTAPMRPFKNSVTKYLDL